MGRLGGGGLLPQPTLTPIIERARSRLPTARGLVPLDEVAAVRTVETPSAIYHDRSERRIAVGFNVRGRDLGSVAGEIGRAHV